MKKHRATFAFVLLALAPGLALAAGPLAPHQLWVGHLLAGCIAALLGYVAGRNWSWAGMLLTAAFAYALVRVQAPAELPELLARFGDRYPFHVKATAFLVPLMVAAGIGSRRNAESRAGAAPAF